jgi:hypothetical protein
MICWFCSFKSVRPICVSGRSATDRYHWILRTRWLPHFYTQSILRVVSSFASALIPNPSWSSHSKAARYDFPRIPCLTMCCVHLASLVLNPSHFPALDRGCPVSRIRQPSYALPPTGFSPPWLAEEHLHHSSACHRTYASGGQKSKLKL